MMSQKRVILSIDTSHSAKTTIVIMVDGKRTEKELVASANRSQATLPLLESILKDAQLTLDDIGEIRLARGPGSFTGLRVGATIASALSILLQVPINGNPPGTPIDLQYSHTP